MWEFIPLSFYCLLFLQIRGVKQGEPINPILYMIIPSIIILSEC